MGIQRVAVTGGSGFIGRAIVEELTDHGYWVANLDQKADNEGSADEFRRTDLLDPGEVYGGLAVVDADAVIHMGTLRGPRQHPGYVTYRSNVMTSYHILEAAEALDLDSVCLASSINAIGWTFQDAPPDIRYLPVDESHPATPREPYGLGKRVIEVTADGFGRRDGPPRTLSTLRFTTVVDDDHLQEHYVDTDRSLSVLREEFEQPGKQVFDYIHVADAASLARHAIEADFAGHETFWANASDTTAGVTTEELIEEFHPDIEVHKQFEGYESLISVAKAEETLGWEPVHSWREM